ncbi:MAG TPA: hypothetical protein ENK91_15360 [Bacteroidetes bacterium]|nr:hypothetical protein [Bacteroidota bacterium]
MKFFGIGILIVFVLLVHACSIHRKPVLLKEHKEEKAANIDEAKRPHISPFIIPSNFFLENRVDNCDSALHFMQNVIEPCSLQWNRDSSAYFTSFWDGFRIPGESKEFLNSGQKADKVLYRNNQRFYISLNCLIGQKFQTVLDIFVKPMFHDAIIRDVKLQEKNRNFFTIEASGFTSFSITIVDGVVEEASFAMEILSH